MRYRRSLQGLGDRFAAIETASASSTTVELYDVSADEKLLDRETWRSASVVVNPL